jgi:sulfatase maturation enzyme AslB (radical SAM superfamily)
MAKSFVDVKRFIEEEKKSRLYQQMLDRWGERYREYRFRWDESKKQQLKTDFPIHLDLDTADACNLHCKYCTEEHGFIRRRTYKRLSEQMVRQVFAEVRSAPGRDRLSSVNIGTLGEPLLHPETVFLILEECTASGVMETFLHTNAQLLTEEIFRKLQKLGLTYLFISLDAFHEETYREIRGKDLSPVVNTILQIVQIRDRNGDSFPKLRVSFLENEDNREEMNRFIEFWEGKVDFVDVQKLIDFTGSHGSSDGALAYCSDPFRRMTVGVQGEMGLCCAGFIMLPELYVGIFPQTTIYEAWNGEKAKALREALSSNHLEDFSCCMKCLSSLK